MSTNLDELKRIKEMMHYGLNESKPKYSSVEYSKQAADGKVYGIVREGTKYYIKVSKDKNNLIKENFEYIGGFMNRKNNEYQSFANALKQFDLKMMSIREAYSNNDAPLIESWNPEKKEFLALETTNKMRKEIMRQRQIMENAKRISEKKAIGGDPFTEDPKSDCKNGYCINDQEDNNIGKAEEPKKGEAVNEKADKLAWHQTGGDAQETIADTYMDKSHGTEIGDGSPFNKGANNKDEMENGVVEEHNTSMAYSDNQNNPEVGTGPVGDDDPFTKSGATQIKEDIEDLDDSSVIDDETSVSYDSEYDDPLGEGDEEKPLDIDVDVKDDAVDPEGYDDLNSDADLEGGDDVESRLSSIESTLDTILSKLDALNSSDYDDDDLYDDTDIDVELGDEEPMGDEFGGDEPMDDEDDDVEIYESRSYRKMKLMEVNRLDDFGKHPAYRKEPMQLPPTGEDKNSHGRDWNDSSVHTEEPYGQQIGDGAPFEIDPEAIENAIVDEVRKILKKK